MKVYSEWKRAKLGDITVKMLGGGTPSTKNLNYWQGNIPWVTSKVLGESIFLYTGEKYISDEAVKESATNVVPSNNLIFATRVGVGKVVVNKINVAISQDCTGIIVDCDEIDPLFLAYQLRSNSVQNFIEKNKRGATIQGITKKALQKVDVFIPPLSEQNRISQILYSLQTVIEKNEKLISLTRELKTTMLNQLMTGQIRVNEVELPDLN